MSTEPTRAFSSPTAGDALLSAEDHDRGAAGMTYVYPVVSRRAGGVSIGINLNVNNACNWRCIYCQVPDLKRGGPPPIDMARLRIELREMLSAVVEGDYLVRHVPEDMRRLHDIALSGNGEPTSAVEFPEVIGIIGDAMRDFDLIGRIAPVLISNGSLMHKTYVRTGLTRLAALGGEVWFKFDRATESGMRDINGTAISLARVRRNLGIAAEHSPTWLQTCVFALDGAPPSEVEIQAYLDFLRSLRSSGMRLRGVLLYGIARPVMQAERNRLGHVSESWLLEFAARIEAVGYPCRRYP